MTSARTYGQACPVARAMDVLGERWAMLVVRELRLGPRRYSDLAAQLPGLGPTVLAARLRELERSGVVRRETLPPPGAARVYALTEWGAELEPVFAALARWGMRAPVPPDAHLGPDPVLLGMRTFFRSTPGWDAVVEVRLDGEVYALRVEDGALTDLHRGPAADPDATLTGTAGALHAVRTGARTPDAAGLAVTGDRAVAGRLLDAVRLPG